MVSGAAILAAENLRHLGRCFAETPSAWSRERCLLGGSWLGLACDDLRLVGLKLIFLVVTWAVSVLGLPRREAWWKDAEILMLRHQLAVALRERVLVEKWAAGLTWDFDTAMISARVCRAGLPAAGDRGVLARAAGAVVRVQRRGDTGTTARGRGAAPGQSQATFVLDRAGRACRARPGLAEGAAGLPDRDPGHAAALAPPHDRGEVEPAQATGTPADPG